MDNSAFAWQNFTILENFLYENKVPQYMIDDLNRYGDYFKDRQWTEKEAVFCVSLTKNSYQYLGQIKNGKRWGIGMYVYYNGDIYLGDFVNGKKVGRGFFFDISEDVVYWGEWADGQMNGRGYLRGRNFESEGRYYNGEEIENFYVKRFDRESFDMGTEGASDGSGNENTGCFGIIAIVVLTIFLLGMCS